MLRTKKYPIMKYLYLAIAAAITLSGCAGTRVVRTDVATGAANPKFIYIRPFTVTSQTFKGDHKGKARREIFSSQAPIQFAEVLKEELEKLAPAMVIYENEMPETGWIVEGNLDSVHAGSPYLRGIFGMFGGGRSELKVHVRVLDVNSRSSDSKGGVKKSNVLYEFDIAGGSRFAGPVGSVNSSGLGYPPPFDYRNAAEKINEVLTLNGAEYARR